MKNNLLLTLALVFGLLIGVFKDTGRAVAQDSILITCGSTVAGEFVKKDENTRYVINLLDGYSLNVTGKAKGGTLKFATAILDPIDNLIKYSGQASDNPSFKTPTLSGAGTYRLQVTNATNFPEANANSWGSGIGKYTLTIQCIDENGQDVLPPSSTDTTPNAAATAVPTQGANPKPSYGFAGLSAVDFSEATTATLQLGVPITDAIPPTGNDVNAYLLDSKAGQTIELNFKYLTGNLSLGVAIVSEDNKTLAATTFSSASTVTTRITLPTAGRYTIGVFRTDLASPTKGKATAYELSVK